MGVEYTYEDEEEQGQQQQENPLNAARKQARKEERLRKAAEERAELAEKALAEREYKDKLSEVSGRFGLTQRQTELLLKDNADVELSDALVRTWANDYGIALANQAEEPAEDEGEPFAPVTRSDSSSPSLRRLTYEQWQELSATDARAAVKAVAEGRVDGLSASANPDGSASGHF